MMARGHPLEYFIEGGRSRTGRLLAPRTGMLSMTVRSYLREPHRPVVFMPVYFGYERIVEGRTYIGELSGQPEAEGKRARPAASRCRCCAASSARCTSTSASPSLSMSCCDGTIPHWRARRGAPTQNRRPAGSARRSAISPRASCSGINAAAAVTPINLVAMAMLATPRQALPEADLVRQLELYQRLLRAAPYAPLVTVDARTAARK